MKDASTPFADAVDNPGSHPTATPATDPSREYFTTALSSMRIPLKCWGGSVPCDAVRRTEMPNKPVRSGIRMALLPASVCQLRNV